MYQIRSTALSLALMLATTSIFLSGCSKAPETNDTSSEVKETALEPVSYELLDDAKNRLNIYHPVDLTADLSGYSENQTEMLKVLIDVSIVMDNLFWLQAYGDNKDEFLAKIADPDVRRFAEINYGPWDRLDGDKPFLTNTNEKSLGAQFYPQDMTKQQFEQSDLKNKDSLYSMITRDIEGNLTSAPYSEYFIEELHKASELLIVAASLADNEEFSNYLAMRSEALLTDEYQASDFAWMDMKSNPIEFVVGPIETYEDQLYGYRAAFESYVLLKDLAWSDRLAKYAAFLPELQKGLPVDAKYKAEVPGANADLNAYDVIYYAGHSNAGSKTIAINLPNDEEVQLAKGTRRLQLKNAMQAKFEHILVPISEQLIVPSQRKHITFTAFFANTMFHEVAHGLGIKNTLDGTNTVRGALKEHASALEEGKADVLGLYMVQQLLSKGAITEGQLEDYYVTFMSSIFRSVRFGASSAHGKANMIRFNYFNELGAFERNSDGLYEVNIDKMGDAVNALSKLILTLQGDGDYDGVANLVAEKGIIGTTLAEDLQKLADANIPVDVTFNQGKTVLGLE